MRNLKRALSLAMATFMLLGMMVVGAGAVSISDFSDGEKIVNKEAVTVLTTLNVIDGRDDGSYDPEGVVTRAEMAKLICVVLNGGRTPQLGATGTAFTDVAGTNAAWAESFIAYCANLGIIAGYGDGTFLPSKTVTAAEASKMLLVALGYKADVEGYVGANWQINVDVAANQNNLYNGLSELNTNDGLSRDNAAQMVFNALNAQMVSYKYVITGTGDNAITTKPQITTDDLKTLLVEKFKADKLEAVVLSNEYANVNNNSYTSADDAGETTLQIVSKNGTAVNIKDYPADTYKVATTEDMLGQRVALYVKTNNNTVGYDADNTIVIGTPIVVSRNKVAEKSDGTKSGKLADDNGMSVDEYTTYLVNYGGNYEGVVYGTNPADSSAAGTAKHDNKLTTMTQDQFDNAAGIPGVEVRLIDNDGDKKVDYALAVKYTYGVINKYDTKDDGVLRIQGLFNEDEYESADVVGFEDVAKDDFVLFTEYGGRLYVEKPETVDAKLDAYSTSKRNLTLDGETVKWSGLRGNRANDVLWVGNYVVGDGVLNTTATYYKDRSGYVFGVTETDESLLTYAVLLGYQNQSKASGTGNSMGTTARARLLMADGTVGEYALLAIDGKAVTNCTDDKIKGSGVGFNSTDIDNIYSYTMNDKNQVRLVKKYAAEFSNDTTKPTTSPTPASTLLYKKGESTLKFQNAKNPGTVNNIDVDAQGNYTVTNKTVFLYQKDNGAIVRYQGRTASSIVDSVLTNSLLTLGAGETATIYANARGEALVVYLNGVNPVNEWKDNWIYVNKEKVTQENEKFQVDAVLDGKIGTYLVDTAVLSDNSNAITRDLISAPNNWGHRIATGLYNYTKDGDIYTLTQQNLTGYDVGTVKDIRDSYIRVQSDTATTSYTVTKDTIFAEARTNEDAQEAQNASVGDEVSVVVNSDNEAVYVYITKFYWETDPDLTPKGIKTKFNGTIVDTFNPEGANNNDVLALVIAELEKSGYTDITVTPFAGYTGLGTQIATINARNGYLVNNFAVYHSARLDVNGTEVGYIHGNTTVTTTSDAAGMILTTGTAPNAYAAAALEVTLVSKSGLYTLTAADADANDVIKLVDASQVTGLTSGVTATVKGDATKTVANNDYVAVGTQLTAKFTSTAANEGLFVKEGTTLIVSSDKATAVGEALTVNFPVTDSDVAVSVANTFTLTAGEGVTIEYYDGNSGPKQTLTNGTVEVQSGTTRSVTFGTGAHYKKIDGTFAPNSNIALGAVAANESYEAGFYQVVPPTAIAAGTLTAFDATESWTVNGAAPVPAADGNWYVKTGAKIVMTVAVGTTGFTGNPGSTDATIVGTAGADVAVTGFADAVVAPAVAASTRTVTFADTTSLSYKSGTVTFTWTVSGDVAANAVTAALTAGTV